MSDNFGGSWGFEEKDFKEYVEILEEESKWKDK